MEKLFTQKGNSYWNENGAYQKEYDNLYKDLVPSSGSAKTVHGELIRSISRLTYDFCNNGNCNIIEFERDSCTECGGSGYEEDECHSCSGEGNVDFGDGDEPCTDCEGSGVTIEDCHYCGGDCYTNGDIVIDEYYLDMIKFIQDHVYKSKSVDNLQEFLTDKSKGYGSYTFDDDEMSVYNQLCDEVMYHVLTTKNELI